jgi:hypothetical protein
MKPEPPREEPAAVRSPDFSDAESRDALDKMAIAAARELGRQAGREWWEEHGQ